MNNKYLYPGLFLFLIITLSYLYDYQHMTFMRPQGYHQWRQTDGAAQALNYYNESMIFFEPRLSLLLGNDGKTTSEFPLVYYIAACLYKIFGPHEFILRLVTLFTFFIGLWYLYKTISLLLGNKFYAMFMAMLLFTSPLIIYYANNFLPDVPALSFTLIGYYYFISYTISKRAKSLIPAAIAFSLAGMTKITIMTGFSAVIGVYVLANMFNIKKEDDDLPWWKNHKHLIPFFITPLFFTVLWVAYAHYYKLANNNDYFLADIAPVWKMSSEQILATFDRLDYEWFKSYFYREFINMLPVLLTVVFIIPKRKNKVLLIWFSIYLLLSVAYLILFFSQFYTHDYYMICMIFLPLTVCTLILYRIKEWQPDFFNAKITKAGVILFFLICVYQGQRVEHIRLRPFPDKVCFRAMMNIEPYLDSIGIDKKSRVISIGDYTSETTLYLMNRRGWTDLDRPVKPEDLPALMSKGAKYIFFQPLWEPSAEKIQPYMPYIKEKVGEHEGALIYSLKGN